MENRPRKQTLAGSGALARNAIAVAWFAMHVRRKLISITQTKALLVIGSHTEAAFIIA